MGKHFSRSYQHSTGHPGGMLQDQQISKTHSKKYTNMLSFYKSLGFPERRVNTLLSCSQYSVLSQRRAEWPQGVCVRLVKKLRRNSFFLKRNFLLNTVSKNTILSLVKCQEALFLLPINFAAIAAAHSAQHTACASPADDPSHLEVIT